MPAFVSALPDGAETSVLPGLARNAPPTEPMLAALLRADAARAVRHAGGQGGTSALAEVLTALWTRFLRFDAADPHWPDRDRLVLATPAARPLLRAVLALTAHERHASADEVVEGGQGIAVAVGVALAERLLAARFGKSLVDHRTWVIASADAVTQGVSHEAATLAGQLRLDRLVVLCEEDAAAGGVDDHVRRFAAQGWAAKRIDGHDADQIAAALAWTLRSRRPSFIACVTRGGHAGADADHAAIGPFWQAAGARGASARRSWLKRMARHALRDEFTRSIGARPPDGWHEALSRLRTRWASERPRMATSEASRAVLQALMPVMPELVGGMVRLGANAAPRGCGPIAAGAFGGRLLHAGVRDHGLAAALNGVALHGGVLPFGKAPLGTVEAMRPALRLAVQLRTRTIFALTQEDGGDHLAEQLAALRALGALQVCRPADAIETLECWELALRRTQGPSLLVLSDRKLPALRTDCGENRSARGAYVLAEADGPRAATLIASGPELDLALAARAVLASEGIPVAVVSLPCWALFETQAPAIRAMTLGGALRVGIEAGSAFGWERWIGRRGCFVGVGRGEASVAGRDLYKHAALTPDAVVAAVKRRLGGPPAAARR